MAVKPVSNGEPCAIAATGMTSNRAIRVAVGRAHCDRATYRIRRIRLTEYQWFIWGKLQNSLNNAHGMISDQYTQDRVEMTVKAISAIANHVSSIPGRKSIVWISGGLP